MFHSAVLLFTCLVFSSLQGDDGSWMTSIAPVEGGAGDGPSISVVNTWQAPYSLQILDLEYVDNPEMLLFVSSTENRIYAADPDDGTMIEYLDRPAGISGFGVARTDVEYFVNSWTSSTLYHSDGSGTWSGYANAAGSYGRGIESFQSYPGYCLWESYSVQSSSTYRIFAFNSDGSEVFSADLPGIPGQISGIAVYPLTTPGSCDAPSVGLIVACYDHPSLFFFLVINDTVYPEGSTALPVSVSSSYGLASAYCHRRF